MTLIISSGIFKGRRVRTPPSRSTRPSSSKCRSALFNICQSKIEGAVFLDLYAGSGAMGIEALSRKAEFAFFVENDKTALKYIKDNISSLGLEAKAKVIFADAFFALKKVFRPCDIIYIDPPYEYYRKEGFIQSILLKILDLKLLKDSSLIFFETPGDIDRASIEKIDLIGISMLAMRKYGSSCLLQMEYRFSLEES